MTTRFLAQEDLTPEQTWRLAEWCVSRGAEEFSITLMGLQGHPEPFNDRFLAAVEPFRLPEAPRPQLTTYVGDAIFRPAALWAARSEVVAALKEFFVGGLFTYPTGEHEGGWLEDPTFYREGEIMFGIVSHEREGYLELTTLEATQLSARGIPTRNRGTWV